MIDNTSLLNMGQKATSAFRLGIFRKEEWDLAVDAWIVKRRKKLLELQIDYGYKNMKFSLFPSLQMKLRHSEVCASFQKTFSIFLNCIGTSPIMWRIFRSVGVKLLSLIAPMIQFPLKRSSGISNFWQPTLNDNQVAASRSNRFYNWKVVYHSRR